MRTQYIRYYCVSSSHATQMCRFFTLPVHWPHTVFWHFAQLAKALLPLHSATWQCRRLREDTVWSNSSGDTLRARVTRSLESTYGLRSSCASWSKKSLLEMVLPVASLNRIQALIAARSRMLLKTWTGHLRQPALVEYFLAIWSTMSTPNFVEL